MVIRPINLFEKEEIMGRKSIAGERRTQVIQAFYRCVVREGAAGASIRKIANEAGVQPSTLHHYFSSRDEIIEEAVVYFTDLIFIGFQEQMENESRDRVSQGIEFIFSKGMINSDHTGFFLECCVAARHNTRIRETIADLFRRFRLAIVEHLETAPGFVQLDKRQKNLLASTIVAIHEGIELQWFADPDSVSLDQALETTRGLISFFIEKANAN